MQKAKSGSAFLNIDHVAIAVEDIETSTSYFERALGFTLLSRRLTRGARTSMLSAVLKAGDIIIVLVQGIEENSQVTRFVRNFGPGVQHIGLSVSGLHEIVEGLSQLGVRADTSIIEGPGLTQVFLNRDGRSGVRMELIERNGGDFTDETVEKLFRDFEARDLY